MHGFAESGKRRVTMGGGGEEGGQGAEAEKDADRGAGVWRLPARGVPTRIPFSGRRNGQMPGQSDTQRGKAPKIRGGELGE